MPRLCVFKTETGKGFCRQMFLEPRAFNDKKIAPRVLRGISKTDLSTSIFGIDLKTPIIEAPSAAHGLEHVEAGRQRVLASALSAPLAHHFAAAVRNRWLPIHRTRVLS